MNDPKKNDINELSPLLKQYVLSAQIQDLGQADWDWEYNGY